MIHSRLRAYVLAISALFLFNSESTWANAQVKISLDCKLDDTTVQKFESSSLFSPVAKKRSGITLASFRDGREFTLKSIVVDKDVDSLIDIGPDLGKIGYKYLWNDEILIYWEFTSDLVGGAQYGLFIIDREELTYTYRLRYDDDHWSNDDILSIRDGSTFSSGSGTCVIIPEKKKKF